MKFNFPNPDFTDLRLSSSLHRDMGYPLITFEGATINLNDTELLIDVNFQLTSTSRIAIVGPNGQGKSSFLLALYNMAASNKKQNSGVTHADRRIHVAGNASCHPNLRIGMLGQHHLDSLEPYFHLSCVNYLHEMSGQTLKSTLEARALLGKFGLSGNTALQQVGSLSGGQKARLCLCVAFLDNPHVLLLDEPSNHFSLNAIESLVSGLDMFEGALVVVSHNIHLLSSICKEKGSLTIINKKKIETLSMTCNAGRDGDVDRVGVEKRFIEMEQMIAAKLCEF